jgi:hypothetical protein
VVAAGSGICPAVIRVENGLLGEIVTCFQELIGGFKLPIGSVVVLSSAAHLATEGLAAYTEAMVAQLNRLGKTFRGGVVGVPGLPVMLNGSNSPELVRSLADLCGWVPALTLSEPGGGRFLSAAADLVKAKLVSGG